MFKNFQKIADSKMTYYENLGNANEALKKFIIEKNFAQRMLKVIENTELFLSSSPYYESGIYNKNFDLVVSLGKIDYTHVYYFNEYVLVTTPNKSVLFKNGVLVDAKIQQQHNIIFINDMFIYDNGVYKFTEKYYHFTEDRLFMYVKNDDVNVILRTQFNGKINDSRWNLSNFTDAPQCMNEEILKNYINLQLEQAKLADKLRDNDYGTFMKLPYNGKDYDYINKRIIHCAGIREPEKYEKQFIFIKAMVLNGGITEDSFTILLKLFQ